MDRAIQGAFGVYKDTQDRREPYGRYDAVSSPSHHAIPDIGVMFLSFDVRYMHLNAQGS